MSAEIHPFKVAVPDSAIESLRDKLSNAVFPGETDFTDSWDSGAPLSDIKRLANRWRDGFDWRAQEAKLNELPQFTTSVPVKGFDDLNIHFVHQRSSKPDSIPLLFVHGWPGSFLEVTKILPLLTEPESGPSFHVVAPSLPNFGFSDLVRKSGFSIPQYAESMHQVMLRLGYDRYVTQGGDWGFFITRAIGMQYPDSCAASHVNQIVARAPPTFAKHPMLFLQHAVQPYSEQEKAGIARSKWFGAEGTGYMHEQRTRPSTIGIALADSPVALLAWIYEKLHDWTDSYPWGDDEALTWISIYQFSRAGPAASARIYYESAHSQVQEVLGTTRHVPGVPLGLSYFPKDIGGPPRTWARALGPVVFEREHSGGGHFGAYERPKELVEDVRAMFAPFAKKWPRNKL